MTESMKEFLEQVIAGIAAGGIYASLALALVLIYRAMGLINFAQGEFAMFTAFICWALLEGAQMPYALAVAITVIVAAAGGLAIERVVVRPFGRLSPAVRGKVAVEADSTGSFLGAPAETAFGGVISPPGGGRRGSRRTRP